MFNILTVIISVALTAIMGAAGVFYMGTAFTSAGPKAQAIGVIQALSQVDGGWTLYNSNGNTTLLAAAGAALPTMTGAATATDLINGGYIASVPTAPTTAIGYGATGTAGYELDLTLATAGNALTVAAGAAPNGGVFIVLDNTSLATCTEVARAGGQITATGTMAASGTGLTLNGVNSEALFRAAFATHKFGCVQIGAAPNLTLNNIALVAGDGGAVGTGKYLAYYKY
jgi:hypothetical protein